MSWFEALAHKEVSAVLWKIFTQYFFDFSHKVTVAYKLKIDLIKFFWETLIYEIFGSNRVRNGPK